MRVIHHPKIIFGSRFLSRFHPFEFDRAERALAFLQDELGPRLDEFLASPERAAELNDFKSVHSHTYLSSVTASSTIAQAIELPLLGILPRRWMHRWFLEPALWSSAASLLAAELALEHRAAVVLGGGFHHAKRAAGEGFCFLNDIALVVESLFETGRLEEGSQVLYLDLDVHQGNGVSDIYDEDERVIIADVFNHDIYPVFGPGRVAGVDVCKGLPSGCSTPDYLKVVEEALDEALELCPNPNFLIYNAGSDIFHEDLLGNFEVSQEGVNERDKLVLRKACEREIPILCLASGGYSKTSARLLADMVKMGIDLWG